jgi:hypothetical protein
MLIEGIHGIPRASVDSAKLIHGRGRGINGPSGEGERRCVFLRRVAPARGKLTEQDIKGAALG